MIYDYEIKKTHKEEILYLYLNFEEEFAKLDKNNKEMKLLEIVNDFMKKNKIKFKGKKIALVTGGLLVATLITKTPSLKSENPYNYNYTYSIQLASPDVIETVQELIVNEEKITTSNKVNEVSLEEKKPTVSAKNPSTTSTNSSKPSSTQSSNNQTPNSNTFEEPSNTTETKEETPIEENRYVTIKRSNGYETIELEEYIIGVVAAEMPASFHTETLKAQAIIARTYALKMQQMHRELTDDSSTQNYIDNNQMKNLWGDDYSKYYNKIKAAVEATKGIYLTYLGEIIEALYHSTSNGYTESASYVYGRSVPYLISVASPYDTSNKKFEETQFLSYTSISNSLGYLIDSSTEWTVISYTSSGRVNEIQIGEVKYTGIEIRKMLGLKSTDFTINKTEEGIEFTTKGWGHGVGLSQYGANGMAQKGSSYIDILKHFYTGISIDHL